MTADRSSFSKKPNDTCNQGGKVACAGPPQEAEDTHVVTSGLATSTEIEGKKAAAFPQHYFHALHGAQSAA